MAIDMRVIGARLDYGLSIGIKARLAVVGSDARIRIDLPTWEWIELSVPIDSILAELHSLGPAQAVDAEPRLTASG